MRLKPSRYNFFYPADASGGVLFNSLSGQALAGDEATAGAVVSLLQQPGREDPAGSNFHRVKEMLVRQAFLVPEDLDELDEVLKKRYARQLEIRGLGLTVAVTKACNFRCVYCYQDHPVQHMGRDTAEALLRFVSERLPPETSLYVTWFGGEPLLNVKIIEFLSPKLQKLCEERGCAYDTFLITNGYRLTPPMAERLAHLGIGDYQITIDGDEEVHDRQRPLAGGQGTFKVVMSNLEEVAPAVSSITVRINLSRKNIDGAARLIERLRSLQQLAPGLSISLGHIDRSTVHCGTDPSDLLDGVEFSACENALLGLKNKEEGADSMLPTPFDTVCSADRSNMYVVAPDGDLFKCWNSLGRPEDTIGRLGGPVEEKKNAWLQFQASDDPECRTCKFLPMCQGGCPDMQIRSGRRTKDCTELRYTLRQRLTEWASARSLPAEGHSHQH